MLTLRRHQLNHGRWALLASFVLYCVALTQCEFSAGGDCQTGIDVATFGWVQVFAAEQIGILSAGAWFANPCLWVSWILSVRAMPRQALGMGALGLLCALGLLGASEFVIGGIESPTPISHLGPGYWLLLASLMCGIASATLAAPAKPIGKAQRDL